MSQLFFSIFLTLLLISHASAAGGPFAWLPLPLPTAVSERGWQMGVLLLLPLLALGSWWLEGKYPQFMQKGAVQTLEAVKFSWGETAVTAPAAIFSVWLLLSSSVETTYVAALVALFWFIYLFLANHQTWQRKWLWSLLALALLLQGTVAVAQFLLQRELGLTWLGEPTLDLLVEGTSVAQRDGQNWLRAYGLNSHPNQLGLLLMALCLMVWASRHQVQKGWRFLFWFGLAAGVAGLLVSLSRTAWMGLLLGSVVFVIHRRQTGSVFRRELLLPLAMMTAGVLLFALFYGDVMAGRFLALDSPLESRSLLERQRDLGLGWQVWTERPLLGMGLGNYLSAAVVIDPEAAVVHNVPLLIAAELGGVGLLVWLWFWWQPLWRYSRAGKNVGGTAVWLAVILFSLFHPEPSLTLPKGAVLWALAAAQWATPVNQGGQV